MWGSDNQNLPEDNEQIDQNISGSELLKPVKVLNDIDKKFDMFYKDILGSLNNQTLYTSKLQNISINDISKSLSNKSVTDESLENLSKQEELDKLLNKSDDNLLNNVGDISIPTERKERYEFYDEIPNVNYIAYRMLKVYLDNILIKNVQTKQIINIQKNQENTLFLSSIDESVDKHYHNFIKTFLIYFDIQNRLKNKIAPGMLKYGNMFVEVINLKNIDQLAIKHSELIQESYYNIEFEYFVQENDTLNYKTDDVSEQMYNILKSDNKLLQENMWLDIQKDNNYNFNDINGLNMEEIRNIHIKLIEPNRIIIIEIDGLLYGYLVIEDLSSAKENEVDILKRFTAQENSKGNNLQEFEIRKTIVDNITKSIINKLKNQIKATDSSKIEDLQLNDSIEDSIKIILYNKIKDNLKLKFRFVQPNNIANFSTNIDKFGPYGTSIFDPIIQPVKMYTLALMSSIVSRLSRASVVRKWTIEAGNKKNHAEIIEKIKKDINNKSISFDSLSNIKHLAQNVTDFKDIATIQVNGQRFIDMEIMPMGDRSLALNDLNDLRTELIAATGIPSVYLNIGDQVDLRETLVSLNTSFATTIASYQSNIDTGLNHVLNSVFNIILKNNNYESDFNLNNYYSLSLNPPLVLTVQSNEALISSVGNIIGMLKSSEVNVDPVELLKLYIPQMSWDELVKTGDKFIKKQAKDMLMQGQPEQ